MSIEAAVGSAIVQVGALYTATIAGESISFVASLQPDFSGGDVSSPQGFGFARNYKAYIKKSSVSGKLRQGERFFDAKQSFKIKRIEPVKVGGEVVYYRAMVSLFEEVEE